jgi:flagellar basal-body rod protein FlgC
MFSSLDISTSGLVAQRVRLDTIAGNIANAQAVARCDGEPGPYKRRFAVFETGDGKGRQGVHVREVMEDSSPGRLAYEPSNPHAIQSGENAGCVEYPNVDLNIEMVDAMMAARAYEANVTAIDVTKSMIASTMRILV